MTTDQRLIDRVLAARFWRSPAAHLMLCLAIGVLVFLVSWLT